MAEYNQETGVFGGVTFEEMKHKSEKIEIN